MPRPAELNPAISTDSLMLTLGQAAALIGISEHTMRRWSDHGRITARRIGNQGNRRFVLAEVIQLRESQIESSPLA